MALGKTKHRASHQPLQSVRHSHFQTEICAADFGQCRWATGAPGTDGWDRSGARANRASPGASGDGPLPSSCRLSPPFFLFVSLQPVLAPGLTHRCVLCHRATPARPRHHPAHGAVRATRAVFSPSHLCVPDRGVCLRV